MYMLTSKFSLPGEGPACLAVSRRVPCRRLAVLTCRLAITSFSRGRATAREKLQIAARTWDDFIPNEPSVELRVFLLRCFDRANRERGCAVKEREGIRI